MLPKTYVRKARAVCAGCPVRSDCLGDALSRRDEWGVWGGYTPSERARALLIYSMDIPEILGADRRGELGRRVIRRG